MTKVVISGTGVFTPAESIPNEALVTTFNTYVKEYNRHHSDAIIRGECLPLQESSADFIVKASGIKNRYVIDKSGILDPDTMQPLIPERSNEALSVQAEMAVAAAQQALANARKTAADIDMVIVACSNMQRPYPAIAIEVQQALGIKGFAYDMNVACASAAFGIQAAKAAIRDGNARAVLMVNPEICSAHLDFRDRDCHFIFGDACSAVIIEDVKTSKVESVFEIIDCQLQTQFSNNIRNNFGFLNRAAPGSEHTRDKLFMQQGRQVFKEVIPIVVNLIVNHLAKNQLAVSDIKRLWLHQANINMNLLIANKILGREPTAIEAPTILDQYANTSSAGSIIAFHHYHQDLNPGDIGVLSAFGAGYSAGSVILRKL